MFSASRGSTKAMRIMRVGIVCNVAQQIVRGDREDLLSDEESKLVPTLIAEEISRMGAQAFLIPADWNLVAECRRHSIDIVLNLAEGFNSTNDFEHLVPSMLDASGIPYTGADAANILLVRDKYFTNLIMNALGVPTPKSFLYSHSLQPLPTNLRFPLILKPVNQEASLGIRYSSVVSDNGELDHRLNELLTSYMQPVLVEEYILGREISIGVWGNDLTETLPPCEFLFIDKEPLRSFRSFESKWMEDQEQMRLPNDLPEEMLQSLDEFTKLAHQALRCRDYSRADYRISPTGEIFFLEHNYNPAIGPNSHGLSNTFTKMAEFAGLSFGEMLSRILDISISRYKK